MVLEYQCTLQRQQSETSNTMRDRLQPLTLGLDSSERISKSLVESACPRPGARPQAKKRTNCTNLLLWVGKILSSKTSSRDYHIVQAVEAHARGIAQINTTVQRGAVHHTKLVRVIRHIVLQPGLLMGSRTGQDYVS